jgi:hypothetical protein
MGQKNSIFDKKSNSKTNKVNKSIDDISLHELTEEEKYEKQEKDRKIREHIYKELKETNKLNQIVKLVLDRLQYSLIDNQKIDLPINKIELNNSNESIYVNTFLLFKKVEQNESNIFEIYFIIENPKDSKRLFVRCIDTIVRNVYLHFGKYVVKFERIEYIIRFSLIQIKKIITNLKQDTYYECLTDDFIIDKDFATDNYFGDISNNFKKCNKCQGFTKNKEYCYFCYTE